MSTILDALKKVERERESPGDRLRHEPEPTPPRSRRVSTVTIVVCAILGFGAGAGIALWRNAAPVPGASQEAVAVPAAPRIEVPPAEPVRVAQPQPDIDEGSALEPSPFARPVAPTKELAAPSKELAAPSKELAAPSNDLAAAVVPRLPSDPELAGAPPPAEVVAGIRPPTIGSGLDSPGEVPVEGQLALPDELPEAGLGGEDAAILEQGFGDPALGGNDAAILDAAAPVASEETIIDTGRSPPGAPRVTLSFLQYSADPARRFAFVSVDGGPSQRVREGDAAGEASVELISPDGVRLRHAETLFVIRPRH